MRFVMRRSPNTNATGASSTPGNTKPTCTRTSGLCEVDRNLAGIPEAVRKLDADLGRLSGRLANFFSVDPGKAMAHQSAINAALRAVPDLRAELLPVLADLQVAIAAPRDRLAEILGAIVRRRKRPESA